MPRFKITVYHPDNGGAREYELSAAHVEGVAVDFIAALTETIEVGAWIKVERIH